MARWYRAGVQHPDCGWDLNVKIVAGRVWVSPGADPFDYRPPEDAQDEQNHKDGQQAVAEYCQKWNGARVSMDWDRLQTFISRMGLNPDDFEWED